MTGDDITRARRKLAKLWGLKRPLTAAQLGRVLQLDGRDPGATVRRWETNPDRYPISGPARVALQLMLAGARPEGAPEPDAPAADPAFPAPAAGAPLTRRRGPRASG